MGTEACTTNKIHLKNAFIKYCQYKNQRSDVCNYQFFYFGSNRLFCIRNKVTKETAQPYLKQRLRKSFITFI